MKWKVTAAVLGMAFVATAVAFAAFLDALHSDPIKGAREAQVRNIR